MSFSYVASTAKASGNTQNVTTDPINTTGANLIVISVAWYSTEDYSVSDSEGNSYTPLTTRTGGSQKNKLFWCVNPNVGSSHTFTATTPGGSGYPVIGVVAVSGAHSSPFDQQNGNGATSGTSLQPGSITPSENGCLVVTGLDCGVGVSISINGGFTADTIGYVGAVNIGGGIARLIQTTAAAVNPTWSWTDTAESAASIASFKSADGGSGPFTYNETMSGGAKCNGTATVSGGTPVGPVTIAINDTDLFFSPYNWYKSGSTYAQTTTPGAYLKTKFTGTSVKLNVDVSPSSGLSSSEYPAILYSVDGAAFTRRQFTSSDTQITLASSLSDGTHTLEIHVAAAWWLSDRWTTPASVVRITGLELDSNKDVVTPDLYSGRMIIYGDSHGEGYESLASGVSIANQDATQAYPALLGRAFSCEYGVICYAGQGYTNGGGGNVPPLTSSWNLYQSGQSRLSGGLLTPAPDYIVSAHGDNDSDGAGLVSAVTTMISNWRTAAPDAQIFIVLPPNLTGESSITTGVNNADDDNTHLIDLNEDLLHGSYLNGVHLSIRGHARYASTIARMAEEAQWPTTAELADAVWNYANRTLTG